MEKLRRCPFCGGEAIIREPDEILGAYVACGSCGVLGSHYDRKNYTQFNVDEAVAHWNKRDYDVEMKLLKQRSKAFAAASRKYWKRRERLNLLETFFDYLEDEGIIDSTRKMPEEELDADDIAAAKGYDESGVHREEAL